MDTQQAISTGVVLTLKELSDYEKTAFGVFLVLGDGRDARYLSCWLKVESLFTLQEENGRPKMHSDVRSAAIAYLEPWKTRATF